MSGSDSVLVAMEGVCASIGTRPILHDVNLSVRRGSVFALVGESGSGKTITSRILTGLFGAIDGRVTAGSVRFDGRDLAHLREQDWQALRGRRIALVPQASLSSLDPIMRIGKQLEETIAVLDPEADRRSRATELLEQVKLPDPERILRSYPHELSGGMRQRVMIALALAGRPELIIADEPTTALDATVQKEILDLLLSLRDEAGLTLLLIAHDLGVVRMVADDVAVMRAGEVVEEGGVEQVFSAPAHPYTRELLQKSLIVEARAVAEEAAEMDEGRMVAEDISVTYPGASTPALHPVSLSIARGDAIGVVGESGSGKSTLGRVLVGALAPTSGAIRLEGRDWAHISASDAARRKVQMIFQDPYGALPAWRSARRIVADVVRRWNDVSKAEAMERAGELLAETGLPPDTFDRLPGRLSGGQCQRVGIARALACDPEILVGDEPTASLDRSTQQQIIDVLQRLRRERGLALVLISHDLEIVRRVTDRVLVMRAGEVVEAGPSQRVLSRPDHAYAQALVAATPQIAPAGG